MAGYGAPMLAGGVQAFSAVGAAVNLAFWRKRTV